MKASAIPRRARGGDISELVALGAIAGVEQHDGMILSADLVDQMRRPQHPEPVVAHEIADVADIGAEP